VLPSRTPMAATKTPDPAIVVREEPEAAAEIRDIVRAGLNTFNFRHSPTTDVVPVTIAARNSGNVLIGGLVGELRPGWKWLYIAMLWVAEPYRIQGTGRRLLRAAEQQASRSGCVFAAVDTISFQARGFYEKEGYTIFGVQEDYPPGHRRFYLRKNLSKDGTESGKFGAVSR
jgi:GNAT superfamily N-acetyltransferase